MRAEADRARVWRAGERAATPGRTQRDDEAVYGLEVVEAVQEADERMGGDRAREVDRRLGRGDRCRRRSLRGHRDEHRREHELRGERGV